MSQDKIYFPNLNGLRFIAAFLVIIHHIEQIKSLKHMDSYWNVVPFINIGGKLGVILFFVLSGFLITYLLLSEEKKFVKISVYQFYMRRVLRIWPLYFLIVVLALFVLPYIPFFTVVGMEKEVVFDHLGYKIILFTLFLPNLVLSLYGIVPYASHTWSIGAEEQYYLMWPVLLKYVRKYRLMLMFAVIVFYLAGVSFLNSHYADFLPFKSTIRAFWFAFNIDCMAIGGVFAVFLFYKYKILDWLMNSIVFYSVLLLVIILLLKGVYIPYIHYEFYGVLFGVLILNFAANKHIKISLEHPILNYLGNISYGLYMYHPIAIVIALGIGASISITSNWLLYPLSTGIVILFAGISYRYYERLFLKFKPKFSKIISGSGSEKQE